MDQFRRPHDDKDEDPRSSAFSPPSIIRLESASAFSKPILPSSSSLLSPKQHLGAPITSNGSAIGSAPSPASAPDPFATPPPAGTRYRECLRNHAASLGGHVIDGCGEFMPAGPTDPLKCAACGCHRSFHRKEAPPPPPEPDGTSSKHHLSGYRVPLLLPAANPIRFSGNTTDQSSSEERNPTNNANPTSTAQTHHLHGRSNRGGSSSSEGRKKRFRTKFSPEQKDRMKAFADRVGWRVQKKDEGEMERFCDEIGVTRQVLKVWMHNNKHLVKRPADDGNMGTSSMHHSLEMQQPQQ